MPHASALVDGEADGIPQVGSDLPLVNQMRLFAFKDLK